MRINKIVSALNIILSVGVGLCVTLGVAQPARAGEVVSVVVNLVNERGIAAEIGSIKFEDVPGGLFIRPNLSRLPPGEHGFHVHENPDCGPGEKDGVMVAALAAGPHFDPTQRGKHAGPQGGGHKGDLPKLVVAADGTATKHMFVPRVFVWRFRDRSIMIHAGGDNYADQPAPLGGGGARIACGVIR